MCFTHTTCLSDHRAQHQMSVHHPVESMWRLKACNVKDAACELMSRAALHRCRATEKLLCIK